MMMKNEKLIQHKKEKEKVLISEAKVRRIRKAVQNRKSYKEE